MTNVEWIATYIFNNPGARYTEITRAMQKWRGRETYCRGWGCCYFYRRPQWGGGSKYLDTHWTYVVPGKPRSGYILTNKGLGWVNGRVTEHSRKWSRR